MNPLSQALILKDVNEVRNPLHEKATEIDGELWIAGNRSLINLNLSRKLRFIGWQ